MIPDKAYIRVVLSDLAKEYTGDPRDLFVTLADAIPNGRQVLKASVRWHDEATIREAARSAAKTPWAQKLWEDAQALFKSVAYVEDPALLRRGFLTVSPVCAFAGREFVAYGLAIPADGNSFILGTVNPRGAFRKHGALRPVPTDTWPSLRVPAEAQFYIICTVRTPLGWPDALCKASPLIGWPHSDVSPFTWGRRDSPEGVSFTPVAGSLYADQDGHLYVGSSGEDSPVVFGPVSLGNPVTPE